MAKTEGANSGQSPGAVDTLSGELMPGFEFGSYVVHECIGRGAMARVYRAEHRTLRKPVALKVMERSLLERPDGSQRFIREGRVAAAVKHPNVVNITDVGVWEDLPYLIMELLEGEDLESYLTARSTLTEAELADLMMPVIAGLDAAHRSGVVHRDLKPGNIFLSRDPQGEMLPKILDFGISKLACPRERDLSATVEGELMGSPIYMSPEAVLGARDLTARSDQYSMGVILYECVTGQIPFEGESLLPLLKAISSGVFPSPRSHRPDLSAELDAAILRAMSLRPEDRFGEVRQLGKALWQLSDGRCRVLWSPFFGNETPDRGTPGDTTGEPARPSARSMPAVVNDGGPRTGAPASRGRTPRAVAALAASTLLAVLVWALRPGPDLPTPAEAAARLPEPTALEPIQPHQPPPAPARDRVEPARVASESLESAADEHGSHANEPRLRTPAARPVRVESHARSARRTVERPAPPVKTPREKDDAPRRQVAPDEPRQGANEAPILD